MNVTREQLIGEINALKSLLSDTDYKALKFAEGEITAAEYADTKADRQAWRTRINAAEAELADLPEEVEEVPPSDEEE